MKKTLITSLSLSLILAGSLSAFAQTSSVGVDVRTNIGVNIRAQAKSQGLAHASDRANQEISRRINALNGLLGRINAMIRLSADQKAGFASTINAEIKNMNDLKVKIEADKNGNNTSSLRSNIQSITKSYRIFSLIIPQGAIQAAADRILATARTAKELGAKLQARITAAQEAGKDTQAAATALADFNAKVADAEVQARAAVDLVASLKPDNGDPAIMQSNTKALMDARAKIKLGQEDLLKARADAKIIIQALAKLQ